MPLADIRLDDPSNPGNNRKEATWLALPSGIAIPVGIHGRRADGSLHLTKIDDSDRLVFTPNAKTSYNQYSTIVAPNAIYWFTGVDASAYARIQGALAVDVAGSTVLCQQGRTNNWTNGKMYEEISQTVAQSTHRTTGVTTDTIYVAPFDFVITMQFVRLGIFHVTGSAAMAYLEFDSWFQGLVL